MYISKLDLNLKIRLFGETLMSILYWMYSPFMLIYFKDQFGANTAGKLMIIPPLIGIFATLIGGYVADRFGRKKMMLISLFLQGITLLIFAFSSSPWIDFTAFLALNVFTMLYRPASAAMVADLVKIKERKKVFALFYAAINFGVVVGPLFGAFFFYQYRRILIIASATVVISLFLIMLIILKETLPESARLEAKGKSSLYQFKSLWIIFTDKIFFIYLIAGALITSVFMQFNTYLAVYLSDYVPKQSILSIKDIPFVPPLSVVLEGKQLFGWMVAENGLVVVLFSMLVATLTNHWSDRKGLIISSIIFGASLWMMSFTTNAYVLLLLMGVFSIGELIRTPIVQNFVIKIAPEEKRGQYLGASSLQFSIGRMLAPMSVILSSSTSPFGVFSLIFLVSIIAAGIYWVLFIHIGRLGEESAYKKNVS